MALKIIWYSVNVQIIQKDYWCCVGNGEYIYIWKTKRLSHDRINSITTFNYSFTRELSYYGSKISVKFNGSCLKQVKVTLLTEKQ